MNTNISKVALFYGHVASNIGDLAINLGTSRLVQNAYPDAHLYVILLGADSSQHLPRSRTSFGDPARTTILNLDPSIENALSYSNRPELLLKDLRLEDMDLVLLAAGEHLFSYLDNPNEHSLFWRMLPAVAAKTAGIPNVLLPSTLGPFEDNDSRSLLTNYLSILDSAAVRDSRSKAIIESQCSVQDSPTLLDPAFFIPPPNRSENRESKLLGLSIRSESWGIRLASKQRKRLERQFSEDAFANSKALKFAVELAERHIKESDGKVVLFVQTMADEKISLAIEEAIQNSSGSDAVEIVRPQSVHEYLARISALQYLATNRFHAAILGLASSVPTFATYFDCHGHKVPGLFQLLRCEDYVAGLTGADEKKLAEEALHKLTHGATQIAQVRSALTMLQNETITWLRTLSPKPTNPTHLTLVKAALTNFATKQYTTQAKAENDQLKHDLEQAKHLVKDLSTKFDQASRDRIATLANEDLLTQEVARLKKFADTSKLAFAEEQKDLKARLVKETHARKALLKSLPYSLGSVLVKYAKKPTRWPIVPYRLMRTWHQNKLSRRSTIRSAPNASTAHRSEPEPQTRTIPEADQGPEKAAICLEPKGVSIYVSQLKQAFSGEPKKLLAENLLDAADTIAELNPRASFLLAEEALNYDKSRSALQSYAHKAHKAGQLLAASDAIQELEESKAADKDVLSLSSRELSILPMARMAKCSKPIKPVEDRICYVLHNSLPFSSGGYATRAQGLAAGLVGDGFEVIALTRPGFPLDTKTDLDVSEAMKEYEKDGVRYLRITEPKRSGKPTSSYMLDIIDIFEEKFRELRPSLVVGASFYITALPALIAARRVGIPFIYEVRGFAEVTKESRDPNYRNTPEYQTQSWMEAATADLSDHVFTLTSGMREELTRRGVRPACITLVPNSCNPEAFFESERDQALAEKLGIPSDVPVIGYIGTFVDYEGLDDLAKACALLKKRGCSFRLLLVGSENASTGVIGPIGEEIRKIAKSEGIEDWVIMPGRVPHDTVFSYYSLIDIAPYPRKPWPVCEMVSPMKPLEALSMHKAVVVSSVQALTDMITHEETGLVFSKGSVESLADRLQALAENKELRRTLGARGAEWVARERTWNATSRIAGDVIRLNPKRPYSTNNEIVEGSHDLPPWWKKLPRDFRLRTGYVSIENYQQSNYADQVKVAYVERFDLDRVNRRIPEKNWKRADICAGIVGDVPDLIDVGSGLGEFVNVMTARYPNAEITSVDMKDYALWCDLSGTTKRVYSDILEIPEMLVADTVTCFEVIEHLDPTALSSAITKLRTMATRRLLVSVPFMEPLPLYRGHYTRFTSDDLLQYFPDATFTVFGKGGNRKVLSWILCDIPIR